jgi:hypothetical protein
MPGADPVAPDASNIWCRHFAVCAIVHLVARWASRLIVPAVVVQRSTCMFLSIDWSMVLQRLGKFLLLHRSVEGMSVFLSLCSALLQSVCRDVGGVLCKQTGRVRRTRHELTGKREAPSAMSVSSSFLKRAGGKTIHLLVHGSSVCLWAAFACSNLWISRRWKMRWLFRRRPTRVQHSSQPFVRSKAPRCMSPTA